MSKSTSVKIVLVGQSTVGKTCIATRYVKGNFIQNSISTVGASYLTKSFTLGQDQYDFNIWDTAGQELYRSLTPMYYRNAHAAFVVFDVTNKPSFIAAEDWIKELRAGNEKVFIVLIGNKIDLTDLRTVEEKQATELAQKYKLPYVETSALSGVGIEAAFQTIISQIRSNEHLQKEIKNKTEDVIATEKEEKGKGCC